MTEKQVDILVGICIAILLSIAVFGFVDLAFASVSEDIVSSGISQDVEPAVDGSDYYTVEYKGGVVGAIQTMSAHIAWLYETAGVVGGHAGYKITSVTQNPDFGDPSVITDLSFTDDKVSFTTLQWVSGDTVLEVKAKHEDGWIDTFTFFITIGEPQMVSPDVPDPAPMIRIIPEAMSLDIGDSWKYELRSELFVTNDWADWAGYISFRDKLDTISTFKMTFDPSRYTFYAHIQGSTAYGLASPDQLMLTPGDYEVSGYVRRFGDQINVEEPAYLSIMEPADVTPPVVSPDIPEPPAPPGGGDDDGGYVPPVKPPKPIDPPVDPPVISEDLPPVISEDKSPDVTPDPPEEPEPLPPIFPPLPEPDINSGGGGGCGVGIHWSMVAVLILGLLVLKR
jgi:hypothetical protein